MPTLFVTHTSHFARGSDGHVYATKTLVARPFWSRYRSVFDRVIVAARVGSTPENRNDLSRADGDGVEFLPLPDYTGPWEYLRYRGELHRQIRGGIHEADAHCLRVPCPIATIAWRELRRINRPFGIEAVGDPWESLAPGGARSIVRPFAKWTAARNFRAQCRWASTALYVTREALQRRYPPAPDAYHTTASSIQLPPESVVDAPRTGISESPRLVLVGTLEVLYKAPDVLIRALEKIGRNNVQLTLVGDGRCRPEVETLAASLGIAKQVTFAGHLAACEAVRAALDAADIFVMPSRTEGLPRAMIEAMARGLPCIGTRVGGIPELLDEQDLVPPENVDALAAKIIEMIDQPDRYAAASARNLETARQYLSSVLEPRRTAFYQELLKRSGFKHPAN